MSPHQTEVERPAPWVEQNKTFIDEVWKRWDKNRPKAKKALNKLLQQVCSVQAERSSCWPARMTGLVHNILLGMVFEQTQHPSPQDPACPVYAIGAAYLALMEYHDKFAGWNDEQHLSNLQVLLSQLEDAYERFPHSLLVVKLMVDVGCYMLSVNKELGREPAPMAQLAKAFAAIQGTERDAWSEPSSDFSLAVQTSSSRGPHAINYQQTLMTKLRIQATMYDQQRYDALASDYDSFWQSTTIARTQRGTNVTASSLVLVSRLCSCFESCLNPTYASIPANC